MTRRGIPRVARKERNGMSKPIVAHGGGLADEALLILFSFLDSADHDGEEEAGILEQQ